MKLLLFEVLISLAYYAQAANEPGTIDLSFNAGSVEGNGSLSCWPILIGMGLAPDSKIYVGSHMGRINGMERLGLARLLQDGTVDDSFRSPPQDADAHRIYPQADGLLWAGWTGLRRYRSSDGSPEPFLAKGLQFPGVIGVFPDGTVLVRDFKPSGVVSRFLQDGTEDSSFARLVLVSDTPVLVQHNGKILVASGAKQTKLDRLSSSGSPDPSFNPSRYDSPIELFEGLNGQIYVSGSFRTVNSTGRAGLVRLNEDGSVDETFALDPTLTKALGSIACLAAQANGKLVVGGIFNTEFPSARGGIARLLPT